MAYIVKDTGGSNFEPVPEGTHIARCINVIDQGLQETRFGAKEKTYISFEVPDVRVKFTKDDVEYDKPAIIGSSYTTSLHEKSILGKLLTSWRGKKFTDDERKGFDLFTVLGAPCLINVTHNESNGKLYANIESIMRLTKGMKCPEVEHELIGYTPMDNDMAKNLDKLPEWLQKKCREGHRIAEGGHTIGSANHPNPHGFEQHHEEMRAAAEDDFDDDIPF